MLRNDDHVLVDGPETHPGAVGGEARRLAQFLLSGVARTAISRFRIDRFGEALFVTVAARP